MRCRCGGVALLAEGVDRNIRVTKTIGGSSSSPSSRRAWIEMSHHESLVVQFPVALLAEGVDRNCPENVFLLE